MNRHLRIHRAGDRGRVPVIALAMVIAALGLGLSALPAQAASCTGAAKRQTTLTAGTATPGSGSPSTTFAFSVRYADSAGCEPSSVILMIAGVGNTTMTTTGTDFEGGVVYRTARRLPVGVWTYRFRATSGKGQGERVVTLDSVSPTSIEVTAPTPTPKPTAKPTPKPSPKPTPKPTAKPTPKPAPAATPKPSTKATAKPTPKPTPRLTATPDATKTPAATGSGVGAGQSSPPTDAGARPSASPLGVAFAFPDGRGGGRDGRGGGRTPGGASDSTVLVADGALDARLAITAWVTTTMFGVLVFAWILRRPQREADSPLAAALSLFAPDPAIRRDDAAHLPDGLAAASATEVAADASMPMGPALGMTGNRPTGGEPRPPLRFEAAPAEFAERRKITYRLVRLSEGPDDLRSREIMRLDRGDEIDIIGRQGSFLYVRTPTGAIGWVPSDSIIA